MQKQVKEQKGAVLGIEPWTSVHICICISRVACFCLVSSLSHCQTRILHSFRFGCSNPWSRKAHPRPEKHLHVTIGGRNLPSVLRLEWLLLSQLMCTVCGSYSRVLDSRIVPNTAQSRPAEQHCTTRRALF